MRGFLLFLIFLFSSLAVDAQEDWFSMKSEDFWKLAAVNENIIVENFNRELLEAALFHATNDTKVSKRKEQLIWNPRLHQAARHQSELMAQAQKLSHDWRKPKDSRTLKDRVDLYGGTFQSLGENIARFYILDIPENQEYYSREGKITDEDGKVIENIHSTLSCITIHTYCTYGMWHIYDTVLHIACYRTVRLLYGIIA